MNLEFQKYVDRLPGLLQDLTSATALDRLDLRKIPKQGVYVFYEGGKAVYAGRSDNLKPYLMSQGVPSSNHFTAPIAFGIAKKEAIAAGYSFLKATSALQDVEFTPYFDKAKARVAEMRIRVVEVKDPIEQSLLVIYASLALQTDNEFETH